jgi:stage II sporulation protein P
LFLNRSGPLMPKDPNYHVHVKKKKIIKEIKMAVTILFLIFLSAVLVTSFSKEACLFFSRSRQFLRSDTGCLDCTFLLHRVLPGMEQKGKIVKFNPPLDFPKLLLDSQLAGLAAADAVKPVQNLPGLKSAEKEGSKEQAVPGEALSSLKDVEPPGPRERPLLLKEEGPLILIYHTHASESFLPESGLAFTGNLNHTVVALGDALARILRDEYGLSVLHHREVFDTPRHYAYEKARPEIQQLLEKNPQIQVVLDLHRDGVPRRVTTVSFNGLDTGRLLFVIGSRHEGWHSNLRFALFLQGSLQKKCPDLSRGILKQNFIYNQHLHGRSLIVEIGGHENSMEEVQRSIPYLAEAVAGAFE